MKLSVGLEHAKLSLRSRKVYLHKSCLRVWTNWGGQLSLVGASELTLGKDVSLHGFKKLLFGDTCLKLKLLV